MKAAEVLKRYAAGERNFQRVNLRGQSFKDQDLSEADFSEADIRSTNFKNANLQGVNFTGAKAGLQKRWVAFLLLISFLLSGILGLYSSLMNYLLSILIYSIQIRNFNAVLLSLVILTILVIFTIFMFRKGIYAEARTVVFIAAFFIAVMFTIPITLEKARALNIAATVKMAYPIAILFIGAYVGAVARACGFTADITLAGAFAIVVLVAIAAPVTGVAFSLFLAFFSFLGIYAMWSYVHENELYALIRFYAVAFATIGGTSFQGANLTDSIFTRATLKHTDFRKAILTRTAFRKVNKLDLALPGKTYLKSLNVQQWLTGTGQYKNFNHRNLHGVNFQGKNLTDASFIGANLSEANLSYANLSYANLRDADLSNAQLVNTNLQDAILRNTTLIGAILTDANLVDSNLSYANLQNADLSRVQLVRAKLFKTNFKGSILTGAFIEDWGITSSTSLYGVKCDYIYLRLPTQEDPDPHRKPDNRNELFEDGDFEDFIKPIFDTLDLYHNQNVDPRAIALSWKKLAENNPDAELEIVAMEKRGQDKFLLRAKTSPEADKSQLNAEYFEKYHQLKAISQTDKKLLAAQDSYIQQLGSFITTALQNPTFRIEGETKMNNAPSRTLKISDSTIDSSGAAGFVLGDISGTAANEINQTPPPNSEDS